MTRKKSLWIKLRGRNKSTYSTVPNNTAAVLFIFWKKFLPTFNFHLNKKKILPTFLFSYVINQVENFPPTFLFGPAVLLGTLEYTRLLLFQNVSTNHVY